MSSIACSKGCFICGNRGDGPARGGNSHTSGCCASTRCDSHGWDRQVSAWLDAEKQYHQKQGLTMWLLAEMLHVEQCNTWLAAELQHATDCQVWLSAQAEFRTRLRTRAVKRIRVQAQPASPQTAKVRASAR